MRKRKSPDLMRNLFILLVLLSLVAPTAASGSIAPYRPNATTLVVTKTYADTHTVVSTFDSRGQLVLKVNARGVTATYAYDDFGDQTGVSYSNSDPSVSYEYYDSGLLWKKTAGTLTWTYNEYDANARVCTVDGPLANDTLTFLYDALGRVAQIDPQGGDTIYFTYDMQGRLVKVTIGTRVFTFSYTGGNTVPDTLTRKEGGVTKSVTHYTYDNLYRLKEISNLKADDTTVITANSFVYNKAHMRTQETLTNAEPMSLNAGSISYTPNAVNQIVSSTNPARAYGHDDDGNMTSWYTPEGYQTTADYDAENRLKSVTYTDSQSVVHTTTFTYDADGLVAKQVVDGVTTNFVRDGYLILQERNSSNVVTRTYAWDSVSPGGIGGLLELTVGSEHYDYLYDGKGNVSALTDANQNVVAKYRYDDFGVLVGKSSTTGLSDLVKDQPYQFSTQRYYASIGVLKYHRRDDLPVLGTWLERDPLGEAVGVNRYLFNNNSPMNFVDPLGLSSLHLKVGNAVGVDIDPFGIVQKDKTVDLLQYPEVAWEFWSHPNDKGKAAVGVAKIAAGIPTAGIGLMSVGGGLKEMRMGGIPEGYHAVTLGAQNIAAGSYMFGWGLKDIYESYFPQNGYLSKGDCK